MCVTFGFRKMSFWVAIVSSVLLASPFQMTQDGFSSLSFVVSFSKAGQFMCVSLMTQKWLLAPAPAVRNEYTRCGSSLPMIFMS